MKEKNWAWLGAVFTAVLGSVLHFVYDWAPSEWTAIFGAVNESTWEHMKLAFWPMLLFGIVEYLVYGKRKMGFLPIRVLSIVIVILLIPILFYSYTGAFGKSITILNLLIFYGAVIAGYAFSCQQLRHPWRGFCTVPAQVIAGVVLLGLVVCFLAFTRNAPQLPLFLDPINGGYGLS